MKATEILNGYTFEQKDDGVKYTLYAQRIGQDKWLKFETYIDVVPNPKSLGIYSLTGKIITGYMNENGIEQKTPTIFDEVVKLLEEKL